MFCVEDTRPDADAIQFTVNQEMMMMKQARDAAAVNDDDDDCLNCCA